MAWTLANLSLQSDASISLYKYPQTTPPRKVFDPARKDGKSGVRLQSSSEKRSRSGNLILKSIVLNPESKI